MEPHAGNTLFVDPKRLLLDMAAERSLPELLDLIVRRMAESSNVILARIWLVRPGGPCETCPMKAECPDQTHCLHLVASRGTSRRTPGEQYARIDGNFRRFPIGVRKVGKIAASGEPLETPDLAEAPAWCAVPEWIRAEGIQGFGGQPLVHHGQVLGVLAVFTRRPIESVCMDWLRMVANHAAAAIANARAWDDIQELQRQLERERDYLREEVREAVSFGDMIGRSAALQNVARQIDLVAQTDAAVLIQGESGAGKELVAREIHRRSRRSEKLLVTVNCAAVPRELFESEFFGHVKGAFTGAVRERIGRFELADGGTLFLDEVGEIPLELQSKLLRVLQEGTLERIGEARTRTTDVRIIAATNRNLLGEVEAGRFRSDLYFRLGVFPIELAPLRRRKEDVALLAAHFVEKIARRLGRPVPRVTLAAVQRLQQYDWPGNIRELQHVLERALITSPPGQLAIDIPDVARPAPRKEPAPKDGALAATPTIMTAAQLHAAEASNLRAAMDLCQGRIYGPNGAAQLLGMKPTTLSSRLKALGIRRPRTRSPAVPADSR